MGGNPVMAATLKDSGCGGSVDRVAVVVVIVAVVVVLVVWLWACLK